MRLWNAISAGAAEARRFLPRLLSIARELFHEIIGFVFFALSLFFALGAHGVVHSFRNLEESPDELPRLLLATFFVILFAGFGLSSWRRARRIARRR